MLIHSVTPIEYLLPPAQLPECRFEPFGQGLLEGTDGPGGFVISRVLSTDPTAYLNPALAPGQVWTPSQRLGGPGRRENTEY